MTAPYGALAKVYNRWTADNDYKRWTDFIVSKVRAGGPILDLCCGTGNMTKHLADRGYEVVGVDRSEKMLEEARASVPASRFILGEVPGVNLGQLNQFAAAICTFDSLNYLASPDELAEVFSHVQAVLKPNGVFVFDVNTQRKLAGEFGDSKYGDDHGDFAYVWRNTTEIQARTTTFDITLFTLQGDAWVRATEQHVQRWFSDDEIRDAAKAGGLVCRSICNDYTEEAADEVTLRQTWVMARPL